MATVKQKEAVKTLVDSRGTLPVSKIMKNVGYSPKSANNPDVLTRSKGYKEELARYGLTEELITTSLVSDIENKEKNRISELRLGAEILGMNNKDKPQGNTFNQTVINIIAPNGQQDKRN